MQKMKKAVTKWLSLALVVAMAFSLNLTGLTVNAAAAKPTADSTQVIACEDLGIASASIGDRPATFYMDDNDAEHMYLRIMYQNSTDVSALENVAVSIESSVPFSSNEVKITETPSSKDGYTVYSFTANLLNKAPVISYDGVDVIVAAGIEGGTANPTKTGQVSTAAINGTAATVTRVVPSNPLPGNIYYNENNIDWVYVGYYINAENASTNHSIDSAVLDYTLIGGGSGTKTVNLSTGSAVVTINGQQYTVTATFVSSSMGFVATPQNFWIDFREMRESNTAGQIPDATALAQAGQIEAGIAAYYNTPGTQRFFPEGTTNMQVLQTILQWCADHNYIDGSTTTLGSNVTYVAEINGLGEFSVGYMSGWMYTDDPYQEGTAPKNWKTPAVGGADYVLSPDSEIAWFYTVDYGTHPW